MRRVLLLVALLSVFAGTSIGLWAAASSAGSGGWATPQSLSSDVDFVGSVSLAVSGNGVVHAVWDDGLRLFHAYGSPTISSPPVEVGYGENPDLAGSAGTDMHLTYVGLFGDQYDVYATNWNGSMWSLPVSPLPTDDAALDPAVAWYGSRGAIAWTERWGDEVSLYLAESQDGALWTAGAVPYAMGEAPDLCLDSATNLLFQSVNAATGKPDIFYSRYNGISWTLPLSVSDTADAFAAAAGKLACLGSEPQAAWQQQTQSGYAIYTSARSASGWSTPQEASDSGNAFSPDLAAASDGSLHLAWAGGQSVGYRRWKDGAWSSVETLDRSPNIVTSVAVAVSPDETVHLAWVEIIDAGQSRVMYSWKAASPETPTPSPTPRPTSTATRTPEPSPTWAPQAVPRLFLPVVLR